MESRWLRKRVCGWHSLDFGSLQRDTSPLESAEDRTELVRLRHVTNFRSLFFKIIHCGVFATRHKRWYTTSVT